jgi:hypothetical protein
MKIASLLAPGVVSLVLAVAAPCRADVISPTGGSSAVTGAAGATTQPAPSDDGGCSMAVARNTSAVAAGLIALALAVGMMRLRRYGMR